MLVTLVAVLCNGQLCMEKIVTTSEQSGITMTACQVHGQIGIADWLAKGPYHEGTLQPYKRVMGKYGAKSEAYSSCLKRISQRVRAKRGLMINSTSPARRRAPTAPA